MLPESSLARSGPLLLLYLLLNSAHSCSITTRNYNRPISNFLQIQGGGCIMVRSLVSVAKSFQLCMDVRVSNQIATSYDLYASKFRYRGKAEKILSRSPAPGLPSRAKLSASKGNVPRNQPNTDSVLIIRTT